MTSYSQLADEIDALIRAGSANAARRKLGGLARRKVPRPDALPLASLARRANLPGLALRLLNPIVRPSAKHVARASEAEAAEYAASLVRVGAVAEALEILKSIDGARHPEALLFESFALMTQWDYAATIPLLTRYLASPGLDAYAKLVGKVNLAAALVQERRHAPARACLEELRLETREPGLSLLHANSLELSAQQAVGERRWREAEHYLRDADQALRDSGSLDELFVRKWMAILALLRDGDAAAKSLIARVRDEALARRHWETVRECDFHSAIVAHDDRLAVHLYFGTPFESYRRRIVAERGGKLDLPDRYPWALGDATPGMKRVDLDHLLGEAIPGDEPLKVGQAMHRLLATLASDFYRPRRIATLHAELYPREYFNPLSSPNRVHRVVHRLKRWLRRGRSPLVVVEENGMYRLHGMRPCRLVVPRGRTNARSEHLLSRLAERATARPFSVGEAKAWLGVSERSAQRLLLGAVRDGALVREGAAAATRYRFAGRK